MTIDARPDESLLAESNQLTLVSADAATGLPMETRLSFVYADGVVYLLAHPEADWYRNVRGDRGVVLRVRRRGFRGRVNTASPRQVDQIAAMFRRKYGPAAPDRRARDKLLPLAVELEF